MRVTQTDARRADHFDILSWTCDTDNGFRAHFRCSRFGDLVEEVHFPGAQHEVAHFLRETGAGLGTLLSVALGVSYYKLGAARQLRLPAMGPAARDMAKALYTEGLAEFYVRAGLPYPADLAIEGEEVAADHGQHTAPVTGGPALVAFGGGKDSYVAKAIIDRTGDPVTLCSVVLSQAVANAINRTAPDPVHFLWRRLDPRLKAATPHGFNGHVPITAINQLMLTIYAAATGMSQVVFANERSADEPTLVSGDVTANHQYSKSSEFEAKIRAALAEAMAEPPHLYSILRPFSELWIGRAFAQITSAFPHFTSCNQNFRIDGDAPPRWCGKCAKCAFTSLILSPFIDRAAGEEIFGERFLDRETLLPFYREICGLTEQKPWDCVGTIDEARVALWQAAQKDDWADTLAVRTLLPEILALSSNEDLAANLQTALTATDRGSLPSHIRATAMELSK